MSTKEFLLAQVEALQNKIKELEAEVKRDATHLLEIADLKEDNDKLVEVIKELEAELKLQDQKRESLEWHYKLESDELKAELKLENENKRSQHVNLCLQIEDLEKDCKELACLLYTSPSPRDRG